MRLIAYPVQVVFLLDLPLELSIHGHLDEEGIVLAGHCGSVVVDATQGILQRAHSFPRGFLLLCDGILEVAGETFNFLDLLLQITPQTCQLEDDLVLKISRLVRFRLSQLVEVL